MRSDFYKAGISFAPNWRIKKTGWVRPRPATGGDNELFVLAAVAADPHVSARQIANNLLDISRSSVHRILKRNKLHQYHIQLVQELYGNDFVNRIIFCHWLTEKTFLRNDFLYYIMFFDESRFNNTGVVNRHNMHYWSSENPHWIRHTAF